MSIFMGFAIGILIGGFLGAVGMFLLIKETREDMLSERIINEEIEDPREAEKLPMPEDPWEAEELPMPEEVKHGDL
jgi:hypothetical protein